MLSSSARPQSPPATGLEVRPFRALTYRERDPGHLARVTSPAYDLVTPAGRQRLAGADPHNIVRLILPRVEPGPPGDTDDQVRRSAAQAASTLAVWQRAGVLERDRAPALWLYELDPGDGGPATLGWLGAVALPPAGSRAVLPHENTFAPAVEGRRALLAATRTDLEPIVLAHDPDETVARLAGDVRRDDPTLHVRDDDGVRHRLWRVTDRPVLDRLIAALRRTDAVIADGHHRFAAAQAHHRGSGAPDSDAVLALLTPMGPGGLRVEAIHRVVPDLGFDRAVAAAARGFAVADVTPAAGDDAARLDAAVRWTHGSGSARFLLADGHRLVELSAPSPEVRTTVPREAPAAWRGLDVVLAHHGLLQHLWQRGDDPDAVLVAHDVTQALRTARERAGVALLLRAPSPVDVAAVARAGARMPRKSTLFVPKPRTGLVLRPHVD